MNGSLRLSDVLARGVSIEWFEAVALVREVAERVRDHLGAHGVPELHQIDLASDGGVSLSGASRTEEPVRRLGQLLQAALVQSDPPVQLRLAASQATAPDPAFSSVREFSDALAYFERPDRPDTLRALFERVSAAPATPGQEIPTLDGIAPLQQQSQPRKNPSAEEPKRRSRHAPAIAAAILIVTGGVAYVTFRAGGASTAQISAIAVKASEAVGTTLVSGLSTVSDKVGLGRLAPAGATGTTPPAKPPDPAAAKTTASRAKGDRAAAPALRIYDLAPEVTAGLPTAVLTAGATAELLALPPAVPPLPVDSHVYSASDRDVEAPVGVRPQLPRALPADVSEGQLGQLELLVLPDGTVGAVRLLRKPRSVLDGMLLSAAKAWTFKPAMKEGRPVAYRKVVWLVLP